MPKILRIINRFNLGGPTFNAAYLTKYLHPEFETKLIGGLKDDSEDSSEFILKGLDQEYLIIEEIRRSINLRQDWKAYQKIKEIIKTYQPDIVHTHASKAGFLGRLAAISLNVPVIVHTFHGHVFHSYFGTFKTLFYKTIERYLARRSSMIIAISEEQKRELTEDHHICKPEKVAVIRLGFDLSKFQENMGAKRDQFRSYYGLKDDEVAIGIVGRLVAIKNHKLFLSVIEQTIAQTNIPVKAFIIGDGSDKNAIKAMAANLNLSHQEQSGTGIFSGKELHSGKPLKNRECAVTFTSWIREIDYAYAGLDLVCLTSLNEGTPVSLIEAQASGKAVISTKVGGVENIIEHEKSGLLSDLDTHTFANYVIRLVNNSNERLRMGQEGINQVVAKYNYQRLVKETSERYSELLSSDKIRR